MSNPGMLIGNGYLVYVEWRGRGKKKKLVVVGIKK